jgi:hypothetical protein
LRLVFFIFPYSETENGFQDYFAQRKTKTQNEKIFFPKTTPRFDVSTRGKTQSLLSACLAREALGRPPPPPKTASRAQAARP